MNNFFFEVAQGRSHGLLPGWAHSWDQRQTQVNILSGIVSGPVPEPTTLLLIGGGLLGTGFRFRRKKKA